MMHAFRLIASSLLLFLFVSCITVHGQRAKRKVAARVVTAERSETAVPSASSFELSPLETDILAELNLARTDPRGYATFIERMRAHFDGTTLRLPNQSPIVTAEGAFAFEEAIAFLKPAKPLPKLYLSKSLTLAARDHLRDLQRSGRAGHMGNDKSWPEARVQRHAQLFGECSELIKYFTKPAREIVVGILVDDGLPKRPHRKSLFNPGFLQVGIASGETEKLGQVTVVVFANNFVEKK